MNFSETVGAIMEKLNLKIDALVAENTKLMKEVAELRSSASQKERSHYNELMEIKKDMERLKKSTPESSSAVPSTPGMYSRVRGMKLSKNRPQSMHEITIPQAIQHQLAESNDDIQPSAPKTVSSGSVTPFYFTLENYAHHKRNTLKWFSPAFYSRPNGHKMCVGVDAAGSSVGEGTHVSVLVYFLRGEFDTDLEWPFRGTVNIWLLNERQDNNHFQKSIKFDDNVTLVESGKVEGHFEKSSGYGHPMFLEHAELGYDKTKDSEFLLFDRLRFLVHSIELGN